MSPALVRGIIVAFALVIIGVFFAPQVMKTVGASDDPVVATVNGDEIRKKEVMAAVQSLPQQGDLNIETLTPIVVDQIVNDRLIGQAADKSNLTGDPEVQKRLDAAKIQIIRSVFLEREIGKIVTDEAIKAEYDRVKSENAGKKETHARHILVKTEEEAKAVIAELDKGADFTELAKTKSTGPTAQNGGDLGWFREDSMVPEFSKIAFETAPGQYAKTPVQTQFGWHVVKVEERRDIVVPELAKVENMIRGKLSQDAVGALIKSLRDQAKIEKFDMDGKPVETKTN